MGLIFPKSSQYHALTNIPHVSSLFTCAFHKRISSGTNRTLAFGLMLATHATSSLRARVVITNRPTDSIQSIASLVIGTVLVVLAHSCDTGQQGITLRSCGASALSRVCQDFAFCTATAGVRRARVQTVLVDAGFVVWAVVVDFTFG